jgi:hypothetical protein
MWAWLPGAEDSDQDEEPSGPAEHGDDLKGLLNLGRQHPPGGTASWKTKSWLDALAKDMNDRGERGQQF